MNILIVKLSAIGDVVHALPVAAALKQWRPDCRISWVVEKAAFPLVDGHPYVDEAILFDKPKFKSLGGLAVNAPRFLRGLRERKFDVVLDLQGLLKSALVAWGSGAKKRYVYENCREGSGLFAERIVGPHVTGGHVTERYLDVVRHLGVDIAAGTADYGVRVSAEEDTATRSVARHNGLAIDQRYAALVLGAGWPNKIWPQEHFAAVGDALYERGIIPVIVGGPSDAQLATLVAGQMKIPPVNLIGKTSLKQLACVLQQASVVIGGDTGPLHLAAALKTPVVALLGPTDEDRNGPYGKGHEVLTVPHDCAGCWKRNCPKRWDCLAAILPEQVVAAVERIVRS